MMIAIKYAFYFLQHQLSGTVGNTELHNIQQGKVILVRFYFDFKITFISERLVYCTVGCVITPIN